MNTTKTKFPKKIGKTKPDSVESIKELIQLFNDGVDEYLCEDEDCKKFILSPLLDLDKKGLSIIYDGEKQDIPGGNEIYDYLKSRNLQPLSHPTGFLKKILKILTERKLTRMRIPAYVDLILITKDLIEDEDGNPSCLAISRNNKKRRLSTKAFRGNYGNVTALICEEIKK